MPKFYVQSGRVRLVLTADSAAEAAARAFQWSCERQAEIYSQASADLIREAEAMEYALGEEIQVNETGFAGEAQVFDLPDVAAQWEEASSR